MKLNRMLTLCGLAAALCLGVNTLHAQQEGGDGERRRGGGEGGGRGNFDPAQMQQRMMENIKTRLAITNDVEWSAIQPLVQKVVDARREVGFGGGGGRFRGGGDAGGRGPGGGFGGGNNSEADALQQAIDSNAPAAQIKSALERYRNSRKEKQTKLENAQADLKKVLTSKQEAQAVLMGLVN